MIQHLFVCGEQLWPALLHCKFPVHLLDQEQSDLRFLSDEKKEILFPRVQQERTAVVLRFSNTQDYIRFVLAYLLAENP